MATQVYALPNIVAAKWMLSAGRARELVAAYESGTGLLGIVTGRALSPVDIHTAALVAIALRAKGRGKDADALLSQAALLADRLNRQPAAPYALDVDRAAIAAASGQRDQAVTLLERAERRGWSHVEQDDLLRLGDEPQFAALAGDARFAALSARFDARIAREKEKAIKLGL